jgi:hypothetical protein
MKSRKVKDHRQGTVMIDSQIRRRILKEMRLLKKSSKESRKDLDRRVRQSLNQLTTIVLALMRFLNTEKGQAKVIMTIQSGLLPRKI